MLQSRAEIPWPWRQGIAGNVAFFASCPTDLATGQQKGRPMITTTRRAILSLLAAGALLSTPTWAREPSLADLQKMADQVLQQDNIDARVQIEIVMVLADRLAKDGKSAEAVRYYEAGLKHYPLDLRRQLACAEQYEKLGKKDEAAAKAKIVAKAAEEDAQILAARKMLGEQVDTAVEAMGKLEGDGFTIVLVPMGDVDVLLLREIRQKAQDQLGVPVLVRSIPLKMPDFGRDPLHDLCQGLRRDLQKIKQDGPDNYAAILKTTGIQEEELQQDMAVMGLFQWLLRQPGNEANRQAFAKALDDLPSTERQWDSIGLVNVFREAVKPYRQKNVRFIGVTRCDIYSENTAFLFANTCLGDVSVMSYRRFMSAFTRETPNRGRLAKRATNQALSCSGKVFGLESCSDPTCPRAYPNSVAEQDAKSEKLCDRCREAFDKVFGPKAAASAPAK